MQLDIGLLLVSTFICIILFLKGKNGLAFTYIAILILNSITMSLPNGYTSFEGAGILFIIGCFRLAKPNSYWARKFYKDYLKMMESKKRFPGE